MIEVSRSGSARRTIFCCNIRQSTDRIARTVRNVAFPNACLLSVLPRVIARHRMVTDRHVKYRPRIEHLEMSRFAELSRSRLSLRSVRSVF